MLYYILWIVAICISLWIGGHDAFDKYKTQKEEKVPLKYLRLNVLKEFLINFFGIVTVLGMICGVIIIFVSAFLLGTPGNKRETVKVESYIIAENSKFVADGNLKFTSREKDGTLEPVSLKYDEINYLLIDSAPPHIIEVRYEDQSHTWFVPWNIGTGVYVEVK